MHLHLDFAIARIAEAKTLEELREAIDVSREHLSFDDIAGSVPDALYDAFSMPEDMEGLIAFTPTHALRIDLVTSELRIERRVVKKLAHG
jgi:hypothetical protein